MSEIDTFKDGSLDQVSIISYSKTSVISAHVYAKLGGVSSVANFITAYEESQ